MTGAGGSVQWNLYVRVGDRLVAERIDLTPPGGTSTVAMRYFTADHLGSIAVLTDEAGAVVERLSYDAWGKRRFPTGADDPTGSIVSQTTRGFTGHEMIDEVGLVNMNGRVYDPQIGRFMSADPFIQDPTNSQSLNRYSYVGNNPLSLTDPTGYFSLGRLFRSLVAIVVAVVAVTFGGPALAPLLGELAGFALAGAIGGAVAAGISGGTDLRSILTGALSGAAFASLGTARFANPLQRAVSFGVTGGVTSVVQGGNFQSGFLAAGFSSIATPFIDRVANDNILVGAAASAVAGGAASVLGGGKFQNGAITGAFSYAVGSAIEGRDRAPGNQYAANDDGVVCDCVYDADIGAAAADGVRELGIAGNVSGFLELSAEVLANDPLVPIPAVRVGKGLQLASKRAAEIQRVLSLRTQRSVTTAVTETSQGVRVVTSSEGRLRPAQRAALQPGEVAGIGRRGVHAEINGVNAARELGLTPIGVAPSRAACPGCTRTLNDLGVPIIGP